MTNASGADLERCAKSARYTGSPEHKSYPSFAGPAKLRSDANRCPPGLKDQDEMTAWLREGILLGNVSHVGAVGYPRYVWVFRDDTWYEARITNADQGWYKGYPLDSDQKPEGAST